MFVRAVNVVGVVPEHALAFEDAIAGVEVPLEGGPVLVIGVDRINAAAE